MEEEEERKRILEENRIKDLQRKQEEDRISQLLYLHYNIPKSKNLF
jgi:hypothetical protein